MYVAWWETNIQEAILVNAETLDLTKAIKIANAKEQSKKQASHFHQSSRNEFVKTGNSDILKAIAIPSPASSRDDHPNKSCYRCRYAGQNAHICIFVNKRCYLCKEMGHSSRIVARSKAILKIGIRRGRIIIRRRVYHLSTLKWSSKSAIKK